MYQFHLRINRYFILITLLLLIQIKVTAQSETFASGSYIINMGATSPNTIANGLKPYGLIYDLLKNYNVPIKWVIGTGKVKDGVDFTYNGVQYRGGTFIIPNFYRNAIVDGRIAFWQGQGVVGVSTISSLTVNVTQTLIAAPRWTLDAANGSIAQGYLTNAGITLAAFPGAYNWKSPQLLNVCDDFFVMPHADPTWSTHSNLFNWNQNALGSIWAACHAVSALENSINPGNSAQQMNFLSTRTAATTPAPWPNNSLTLWGSHAGGSMPYTHQLFDDPVAQYLGTTDAAQLNGSEQIYLPKQDASPNNTRWRPGSKIIAYDPTQANVLSPDLANGNIAALIVYGRAFDDVNRGFVMYEAGHSHNKGTANDVAAQRAFLNFSFFQVQPKVPNLTVIGLANGQTINSGDILPVSVSATSPLSGVTFTYLWTSSCGGTFANATAASTTFTAPVVASPTPCVITCVVSDNCGRTSFKSYGVTILSGPQPPVANPDAASVDVSCGSGSPVTVNVLANDTDPGNLQLTLTNVSGVVNGTVSFNASGNVTFIPNANFTGPLVLNYTVCNNAAPTALCSNSTLTISLSGGSTPAALNDTYTIAEDAIGIFNVTSNDALGLTVNRITAGPSNGRVSINIDNTITYLPNADFSGTDNFTYKVINASGGTNIATVTINVTGDACGSGTYQVSPGSSGSYSQIPLKDNSLREESGGNDNFGASTFIRVDGQSTKIYRGLMQFDFTGIPANAVINNSNLSTVATTVRSATAYNFSIHRITNTWDEGTLNGGTGISNWVSRLITGPVNWTAVGGDFDATAHASTSVSTIGTYNWTGGTLNSLIQNWTNGTNPNNGLMLKFTTEGTANDNKDFGSRENTTAANRPLLTFNWTTPPTCAAIPTRAPMAMPDTASTPNGVTVNIPTESNDYYPNAGARTYSIVTAPASGIASIDGSTGIVTYTPNTTFNGVRSLTYRVLNTVTGLSDTARVYINITNGQIVANTDNPAGALSGTVQTINVKANDVDPEIASLNNTYPVTIITQPVNGSATVDGSGNILYTPNAGFTGTDVLTYQVCEPPTACGSGLCATANVNFIVLNRPPVATNDTKTILPCFANTINLIGNDTDPENGVLTVTNLSAVSPALSGNLVNNNDGTVTLTPATGFTGTITFTYTVRDNGVTPQTSAPATVTINVVNPVNTAPVAVNDVETTLMDEVLYASVRDNDYDPENNPLTNPVITIAPVHGMAVVNNTNGTIEYTPNPGFYGTDVLTYRICDLPVIIVATCTSGQDLCATATLTITVEPTNTVIAINDENSTWINTPVSGGTLSNDFDPNDEVPLTFLGFIIGGTNYTSGSHIISGVDANGSPVANAGTILINANGTYTFTPANNFTGVVDVPYTIKDANLNTAYDTASLRITVNPMPAVSNSIIANNDENRVLGGSTVNSTLFANDVDPQGNPFTVTTFKYDTNGDGTPDGTGTVGIPVIIGGKTSSGKPVSNAGILTVNSNGTYTFTAAPDFHGSVDVPYTICDNIVPAACATANLHINVMIDGNGPANNQPQPGDDFTYTNVNTPVTSSFILNDSDPNGDPVSLNGTTINTGGAATPIGAPVATVKGGTVQFFANGTYSYTPAPGYVGPDSVGYEICDVTVVAPQPLCNIAFIHMLVGVNNSTEAINDETSTWQDVNVDGNVVRNDFDAENHTQNFGSFLLQNSSGDISSGATLTGVDKNGVPVANAGTISFDANGNYTFDPDPAFTGTVTVPYRLCDVGNQAKCDTAFLTITIDPLPNTGLNTIIANNDENISYGAPVGGSLFVNDIDPQNDAFTVTSFTGGTVGTPGVVAGVDQYGNPVANAGTLTINANGTYNYTPAPGFVGSTSISYTITDVNGATSTAVLHIDVKKDGNGIQNDPPFAGDDFGYTTINKPVIGNYIANDSDPNSDPVSVNGTTINPAGPATPIGAPVATLKGGTIQFYANGTYLYTPPAGYVGPDNVSYTICDVTVVAPQPLCADADIHLLVGPGIDIAGKVWNDANGNVVQNGAGEPATNVGGTLYVNLLDASGNVVATTPVANDGTYSFANVNPGANYSLQLTTNIGTVGALAPATTLPNGWTNTGETRNGTIDGGLPNVIDSRNFGFTNSINFDFGIEQLPETDTYSTTVPQPTVGQFFTLNGGANPPALSGSDVEDCAGTCGVLTNRTIIIDAVPANSELYYNGILVTNGQQINNYNPALLQMKITATTNGAISTSFQYSFVDAAGKKDPTPANYTLSWAFPLPVKLSSFSGKADNCKAILQWTTAQELNTDKFILESSTDGISFSAVAEIKAANAANGKSYQQLLVQSTGLVYYRLKMVDLNGSYIYSFIVPVKTNCNISDIISIYPNPVRTTATLNFNTAYRGKATIVTTNALGQQITSQTLQVNNTINVILVDVQKQPSGVYFLYLANEKGERLGDVQKLIKE